MSWKRKTSPLSIVSLVFSLVALYMVYLASLSAASITVSVARLTFLSFEDSQSGTARLAVKVTCVAINSGARNGVLEDVVIRMEHAESSKRWLLVPFAQVDEKEFTAMFPKRFRYLRGEFRPIAVGGKESTTVPLVFFPSDYLDGELTLDNLEPGSYEAIILARQAGEPELRKHDSISFTLKPESVAKVKSGVTYMPATYEQHGPRSRVK